MKDFEPIALVASNPLVIVSKKTLPAKDLRELVEWVKANPNKVTLATAGPGSPPHIAGVLFENLTSTRLLFVPYRGAAPGMQDLLAGHIDLEAVVNAPADGYTLLLAGPANVISMALYDKLNFNFTNRADRQHHAFSFRHGSARQGCGPVDRVVRPLRAQ